MNTFLPTFSTALAASCAITLSLQASELTPHQQLGRDIYQELIETDTTHSTGDTTKAAESLARRFRDAGFSEADVRIIGPAARNKNLVVRYRGAGTKPPVALLAHLDVVEAKREDWSLDPFKLTERNGFFYGRGTADDKGGATTLSAALLRLRRENFKPNCDLILALTSGEEGGSEDDGAKWLLTNRRDLVNARFCLNADAGGPQKRHGKYLTYSVQAAEKIYQSFRLEVKGSGGHSSVPTKDNPIYRLAAGLLHLSQFEFPPRFSEITRGYFQKMSAIETGQTAADMRAILKTPPDPDALKRLAASPFHNALLRTTAVATMLEGGHAENALPQTARATVNCRLLPDESPEEVAKTLRRVLADDQISLTPIEPAQIGPASPLAPEIMQAIEQAKEKLWPGLPVLPVMETGATDGLFFRQLGIPTYGIIGIAADLDDIREHGKDERVAVKDFYDALEFEYQLIKSISTD
ncbi:MAG: M20/M25/M40 family metallo-hydrolase [Verrucomicrobia bacterium]|nr:M20/M25/M40 family metallo-hydrolase [Verrucomicrobiota bacterium]